MFKYLIERVFINLGHTTFVDSNVIVPITNSVFVPLHMVFAVPCAYIKLMRIVLELCKKIYPIRNCNFNLSEKNIAASKFKVCLEYQIGNCKGACEGLEREEEYLESIKGIRNKIGRAHV